MYAKSGMEVRGRDEVKKNIKFLYYIPTILSIIWASLLFLTEREMGGGEGFLCRDT